MRNEIELKEGVQTRSLEGKSKPDSGDGGTKGSLRADMCIGGLEG